MIGSVENVPKDIADKMRATGIKSAQPSPTKTGAQASNGSAGASNYASMANSSLYQISIPDGLESRTYGALYRLLSRRKQIPLGILRGVFSNTKSGPKANKLPYVFTNPPKDTELFTCDKVFVLSQTPVGVHHRAHANKVGGLLFPARLLLGVCFVGDQGLQSVAVCNATLPFSL